MSVAILKIPGADFSGTGIAPVGNKLSPASVGTLLARFSAKEAASMTMSGGAVTAWADTVAGATISDGGRAGARPTYSSTGWSTTINGKTFEMPCLVFDGVVDGNTLSGALDFGADTSVFFVCERSATQNAGANTTARVPYRRVDVSSSMRTQLQIDASDPSLVRLVGNSWPTEISVAGGFPASRKTVFADHASTAGASLGINGGALTSVAFGSAPSGSVSTDEFSIGGLASTGGINGDTKFAGKVAEVLVYAGTLTTEDRQKIEGHLAWEWGIAANLAAGHPYRSAPPSA